VETTRTTVARTRNRRGQGAQLREDIVTAASQILEATGQDEAVTLRAVAREVGITAPSIYAHFPDRVAIVMAVAERTFDELTAHLRPAAASGLAPVPRLQAVARAYLDFAATHPHAYRVLFERHRLEQPTAPAHTDPGADVQSMVGAQAFAVLLAAVRDCIDSGASTEPSALQATIRLWIGLHGLATLHASLPWFPWPPTTPMIDQLIDRLTDLTEHDRLHAPS
jgi:AcrR family transcriptional regulator